MPARSKAQQRLMGAAEHGASFPLADKIRSSMTHDQMHAFAVGPMKGKPAHVKAPRVETKIAKPRVAAEKPRIGMSGRPMEVEEHRYDWRQRSGLKRGRA